MTDRPSLEDRVADTLFSAFTLWDDLAAMEHAGIETGYKKGVPRREAAKAKKVHDEYTSAQDRE